MLKRIFFLAFVIVFSWSCKTQKQLPEPSAVDAKLANALLWKIEGNELEEESYLYGTIHLITKEDFYWPKGTLAAFDASESVVFEIDMDDMFDMSKQMGLLSKAFMNDGMTLKDLYNEEDYDFVKTHFDDMGIPMFFLERLKPMFLTVFASGDMEFGVGLQGDSGMRSYEMELFDLCQQSEKEVEGLETIEFQMSVFDSIPYQDQADMLLETIKSSDTENDAFDQMIDMYKSQNINLMVDAMAEDEGISGYEDLLLNQRNRNWIPVMSSMMKEGTTFFAVGAGHLAGEQGVIKLLKAEGYKLTPVSSEL